MAGAQALRAAQFAILDFYHAAQNLWKAAAAALDGRTTKARQWFKLLRHQLRHGESEQVIAQLAYEERISSVSQVDSEHFD